MRMKSRGPQDWTSPRLHRALLADSASRRGYSLRSRRNLEGVETDAEHVKLSNVGFVWTAGAFVSGDVWRTASEDRRQGYRLRAHGRGRESLQVGASASGLEGGGGRFLVYALPGKCKVRARPEEAGRGLHE